SQNMTDVYIAVIFGFIGYLMRKYGIPPAPVVLGLILGPMADSHFYQATRMAGGPLVPYMLSRPISIVIMLMILAALFAPFISKIVAKRYQAKFGEVGEAAEDI
ncbi:MAG: hypothetical protein IJF25_00015, partial [Oscillospiraceae bacterium]|nr:hypothetical protein [Oscillospiraceae bacterium]